MPKHPLCPHICSFKNLYELEGAHESRNPLIARVLRENKLMRELGEGMRRIFDAMYTTGFERPTLYSNGVWFSIAVKAYKLNDANKACP
jgi:ATP-dependent DNA helicase RecG